MRYLAHLLEISVARSSVASGMKVPLAYVVTSLATPESVQESLQTADTACKEGATCVRVTRRSGYPGNRRHVVILGVVPGEDSAGLSIIRLTAVAE